MHNAIFLPPTFSSFAIGGIDGIFLGDIVEVLVDDGEWVGGVGGVCLGVLG